ncbi:hypothetical protein [Mesorhizobium sp. M8A.F.Ca.ET.165.01.1.1]|uniref:hypothetical protein n=1 Tax=Mesorhizobium sp. M8A.F.Ca.ET.165.01.1.1 TaxID=2563960 RepID=UPI001679351F|nr:hypothetical protein [Mesorhizobium sp. M8A.F.Ca.ET.165.01.1.1]
MPRAGKSVDPIGINQFRKLWNGGERRRALELAQSADLSEDEWAALHSEFPGLLELINT